MDNNQNTKLKDNLINIINKYKELLDSKNSNDVWKVFYTNGIDAMIKYISDPNSEYKESQYLFLESLTVFLHLFSFQMPILFGLIK